MDILLISEFYYKNIWGNKGEVRLYIDKDGNLTRKPSAYYIGKYKDHGDKTKDIIKEDILKRAKQHADEYQIGYGTTSLTKYLEIMRRNTEKWD